MLLAGCVLVKNEEQLLHKCLSSLKKYTDELIVVDNGSTDNSRKVAEQFGAKVILCTDKVHDAARNAYVKEASAKWILALDCDEIITEESGYKIREKLSEYNENVLGVELPRYDYIGEGKWAEIGATRIFKNLPHVYYNDRDIHATVVNSIEAVGGDIEVIYEPIHHLDVLFEDRSKKKREGMRKRLLNEFEIGEDTEFLHCMLGLEYAAIGNFEEAIKEYDIAISKQSNLGILFKAQTLVKMGEFGEAKHLVDILPNGSFYTHQSKLILQAELAIKECEENLAKYYIEKGMEINPLGAHWYINMAYISTDIATRKRLLKKAFVCNPFLANPVIYGKGDDINLFKQQSSFLSVVPNLVESFVDFLGNEQVSTYLK